MKQDFQRSGVFILAGQYILTAAIKSLWEAGVVRILLGEQGQLGRLS